jgi:hypothetical protein
VKLHERGEGEKTQKENKKLNADPSIARAYLAIQSHRLLKPRVLYEFVCVLSEKRSKLFKLDLEISIVVKNWLRESTAEVETTPDVGRQLTLSRGVHVVGHEWLSWRSIEVIAHSLWHSDAAGTSRSTWIASRAHERLIRHHLIVCRRAGLRVRRLLG